MIDEAALEHTGRSFGLAGTDLSEVLDPWRIVLTRRAEGGAAPDALADMVAALRTGLDALDARAAARTAGFDRVEQELLDTARARVQEEDR
jgi:argininosuccinate lyase